MRKNSAFSCFWPFSLAIAHSFGVPRRFAWPIRPNACLRVMTKNSMFLRFMVVFMSYCPHFWGSTAICTARKTQYMLESYEQNVVAFAFYRRLLWPIAHNFGVLGGFVWNVRLDTCLRVMKKTSFSRFIAVFMRNFPEVWEYRGVCMADKTQYMFESNDQKDILFVFYGRFHGLFPVVLGFQGDLHGL